MMCTTRVTIDIHTEIVHCHIKIEVFGMDLVTSKEHRINVDFSSCKVNHILMESNQKGVNLLRDKFSNFV